jgi:hypothetical protein
VEAQNRTRADSHGTGVAAGRRGGRDHAVLFLLEPKQRRSVSAVTVADAGAAYLGGGLGVWEFPFCGLMTYLAHRGLEDYRCIGIAWVSTPSGTWCTTCTLIQSCRLRRSRRQAVHFATSRSPVGISPAPLRWSTGRIGGRCGPRGIRRDAQDLSPPGDAGTAGRVAAGSISGPIAAGVPANQPSRERLTARFCTRPSEAPSTAA